MELKILFIVSVAVLIFTLYYMERVITREEIFWIYASLGLFFAFVSVYTVARDHPTYEYFLTFTTLFILIAILYYGPDDGGGGAERKPSEPKTMEEEGSAA